MSGETVHRFPPFEELPLVPGTPKGSIWGLYDKDGKKDQVGGEQA